MSLIEALTALLLLTGAFFMLMAAVGILRMPDLFMRMSATTKSVTLGVSFSLLAVALHFNDLGHWRARAGDHPLRLHHRACCRAHDRARRLCTWRGAVARHHRRRVARPLRS